MKFLKSILPTLLFTIIPFNHGFTQVVIDTENVLFQVEQEMDEFLDSIRTTYTVDTISEAAEPVLILPTFISPNYNVKDSYSVTEVPNPKAGAGNGFISDPNDYLTAEEEQGINALLYTIEQNSSAEIAIVMLPSIGIEVPKDFGVALFEEWGIGKADTDNGLLLLSVMDQRRTEFETGYGLEPILPDIICYRIGQQEIVPYFKQEEYGKGLLGAVIQVKRILDDPDVVNEIYSTNTDTSYGFNDQRKGGVSNFLKFLLLYLVSMLSASIAVYFTAFDIERSKDEYYDKYHRLEKVKTGCLTLIFPIPFIFLSRLFKKRLKEYRYAPRYSRIAGKPMVLLNEWKENDFLHEAQIIEEKLRSKRYDVWVTPDKSEVLVLEYAGTSTKYESCPECAFKTYGLHTTKSIKVASYTSSGNGLKIYKCKNCNYKLEKPYTIPKKVRHTSSSSGGSSGGSWSSSSSSSSSRSSSFGGGSSGGGGAGVSW